MPKATTRRTSVATRAKKSTVKASANGGVAKAVGIAPCLWFDNQAEEAAKFYTGIFKNSQDHQGHPLQQSRKEVHGRPPGSVMTVAFELDGQPFTALNGGPRVQVQRGHFVPDRVLRDQKEIDYYWEKLTAGGDPEGAAVRLAQGQVRPVLAGRPQRHGRDAEGTDLGGAKRAMEAMMGMKKIDIAELERAAKA